MGKNVALELLKVILGLLKPELLRTVADKVLDSIEEAVEESDNKIDDIIILPICAKIREAFGIEDEDN